MRIFRRIGAVITAVGMLTFPTQRSGAQTAQLVVPTIPNGAAIAAGNQHTMVLKTDGTLWTFGDNSFGQLGFAANSGTANPNPVPTRIMSGVASIAAGYSHSLVLKTDGTLWTFGKNDYGQLGNATNLGTNTPNPTPMQVMAGVQSMAAGHDHSLVLKVDGTLWAFGNNVYGQLGLPTNAGTTTPNPVPAQVMVSVIAVAAGYDHSLVIKSGGAALAFGSNRFGQLGIATNSGTDVQNEVPVQVLVGVASVAAGGNHSLLRRGDGGLFSAGLNSRGQLGSATNSGTNNDNHTFTQVMLGVMSISASYNNSAALKPDGSLWTFGFNSHGQLGTLVNVGTNVANPAPTQVMSGVAAIASGGYHTLAVKTDGSLWTFGNNFAGQLGSLTNNANFNANATPTQVLNVIASYYSVVPGRLMDTRPGGSTVDSQFAGIGLRSGNTVTQLAVVGRAGVPANATAVALNVTATGTVGDGFVTVYPCGSTRPNSSNLNFTKGVTIPNLVITQLDSIGKVCLYTDADTHLLVDISGYYPINSPFVALVPGRLMDTRPMGSTVDNQQIGGDTRVAGSTTEVLVGGRAGVPIDASAVTLNVTVTGALGGGYATVYPCGGVRPNASNLNYETGLTIPNAVITSLGTGGKVCIYVDAPTQLLVDINGYYPAASPFTPVAPSRLVDTRPNGSTVDGQTAGGGIRSAASALHVQIGGRAGVPADASAVALNVTVTGATGDGFATVYPCDAPRPNASNLNYTAGQTVPNAVVTKLDALGQVCIYTDAPTHLLVDVNGYYPA